MNKPKWTFKHWRSSWSWIPRYTSNGLLWKDKYGDPRHELSPQRRIQFLWFTLQWIQGEDEDYWEQWLWVHQYNDGDVEKAKETWGWVDYKTKQSTWKNYE